MDYAVHCRDNQLCEKLKAAEFWGVFFDGSEDIKVEQEIVYIVLVSSSGEFRIN